MDKLCHGNDRVAARSFAWQLEQKKTYWVERVLQPPGLEEDPLYNKGTMVLAENQCVVIIGLLTGRSTQVVSTAISYTCTSTVVSINKQKTKRESM